MRECVQRAGKKDKVRTVAYFETVLRNVAARHEQISESPGQ